MHVFPVETARLLMRPIEARDAALYEQLYTDAETMRFIGAPLSPERVARSFRSALAGMQRLPIERLFLAVMEKATNTAVGLCSLQDFDAARRSVQVGMMFVAAARARGHAKEGLIELIQQVFARLPVDELWVECAPDHVAVQRLMLSVGFAHRGDAARQESENGQWNAWSVRRHRWSPPSAPGVSNVGPSTVRNER